MCGCFMHCDSFKLLNRSLLLRRNHRRYFASVSVEDSEKVHFLLERDWLLREANSRVDCISIGKDHRFHPHSEEGDSVAGKFYVVRDELLHPIMGGNKLRKLDALIPYLKSHAVTDVVTCGGCQSAHVSAIAVACAENGMAAHLLLRGEALAIPTGYNLISHMYGHVTYVPRCQYSDRRAMLEEHSNRVAGTQGSIFWLQKNNLSLDQQHTSYSKKKKVAVVEEGACDPLAIPGLIRQIRYLRDTLGRKHHTLEIVVDSGTGTTAIGLAIGIRLLRLPWKVIGVMLADSLEGYVARTDSLVACFNNAGVTSAELPLIWKPRLVARRFGKIFKGEVEACKRIARDTGILLDPIYTLAAWEVAVDLGLGLGLGLRCEEASVVMVHTGGTLGLFGLAQRKNQAAHFLD